MQFQFCLLMKHFAVSVVVYHNLLYDKLRCAIVYCIMQVLKIPYSLKVKFFVNCQKKQFQN